MHPDEQHDAFSLGKIFPARIAVSSLPLVIGLGVVAVILVALDLPPET